MNERGPEGLPPPVNFSRELRRGERLVPVPEPALNKLTSRVFKIHQSSPIAGELELLDEGSNQCFTGQSPRVILLGNTLNIETNPRIRTPGFDGTYELTK
jgi:hypothetical protein